MKVLFLVFGIFVHTLTSAASITAPASPVLLASLDQSAINFRHDSDLTDNIGDKKYLSGATCANVKFGKMPVKNYLALMMLPILFEAGVTTKGAFGHPHGEF
jgi:hypothetical protein